MASSHEGDKPCLFAIEDKRISPIKNPREICRAKQYECNFVLREHPCETMDKTGCVITTLYNVLQQCSKLTKETSLNEFCRDLKSSRCIDKSTGTVVVQDILHYHNMSMHVYKKSDITPELINNNIESGFMVIGRANHTTRNGSSLNFDGNEHTIQILKAKSDGALICNDPGYRDGTTTYTIKDLRALGVVGELKPGQKSYEENLSSKGGVADQKPQLRDEICKEMKKVWENLPSCAISAFAGAAGSKLADCISVRGGELSFDVDHKKIVAGLQMGVKGLGAKIVHQAVAGFVNACDATFKFSSKLKVPGGPSILFTVGFTIIDLLNKDFESGTAITAVAPTGTKSANG